MPFPASSVAAPALTAYQWSMGGVTIGSGQGASGWAVEYADGLGWPSIQSGDVQKPVDTGQFPGKDLPSGRDITLQLLRFGGTSFQLGAAKIALDNAYASYVPANGVAPPGGEQETPLWTNRPGFGTLAMMVRGRGNAQRAQRSLSQMKRSEPLLAFHATDPRLYGPTVSTVLNAPSFARGLTFPLTFPISFGGGSAVAQASINNTGTYEMRPVIYIVGPCKVPAFANATQGLIVAFNVTLNAGDQLIVTMDTPPTALLVTAGTTVGVSRMNTLVPGSQFWNLPKGTSIVQFSTSDTVPVAATCTVQWAPAYMAAV